MLEFLKSKQLILLYFHLRQLNKLPAFLTQLFSLSAVNISVKSNLNNLTYGMDI